MTPDHSALIERLEDYVRQYLAVDRQRMRTTMQEAAAALRDLTEWRNIATAPKDGTWVQAWREPSKGSGIHEPVVFVRWCPENDGWVWPSEIFDPISIFGRERADFLIEDGDFYIDLSFTHWLPLPSAPNQAKEAGE